MTLRLNLAALTDLELQALVGSEQAMTLMPDITRARLSGRAVTGPQVSGALSLQAQDERSWGSTPEQTRALTRLNTELLALTTLSHGVYRVNALGELRYVRAYTLEPHTAVFLRWRESDPRRDDPPFVQLLSCLRDRVSGTSCVLTTSAAHPATLTLSEELDVHHHPQVSLPELFELHQQYVSRHGKAQKLNPPNGWRRIWQAIHQLNLKAWQRRGLLIESEAPA